MLADLNMASNRIINCAAAVDLDDVIIKWQLLNYLDTYLSLSGGDMNGNIGMQWHTITGLPVAMFNPGDAISKQHLDTQINFYFKKDGTVTATGNFNMGTIYNIINCANPVNNLDVANIIYIDTFLFN